jgi:hypothetical protein
LTNYKFDNSLNKSGLFNPVPVEAGPRVAAFRGGAALSIRLPSGQIFTDQDHYAAVILSPSP